MDLNENNPNAAETRVPLPNHSILDVLQFTPVCVVCTICKKPINGTVRAVKIHMSNHFIIPDGTQFRIGNQLQLGMDKAKQEDVATLLQDTEESTVLHRARSARSRGIGRAGAAAAVCL